MLRGILGPERYEVRGDWRKLRNVELHNLYSLPSSKDDQVKEDEMNGA